MIEKCASFCTDKLFQNASLPASRRPVYQYGCELFLSTSASTTTILLVSAVLSMFDKGDLFLTVFIPIRFFAGGYLFSSYGPF